MLTYDRIPTDIGTLTVVKGSEGVCYIGLPNAELATVTAWGRRHFPGESLKATDKPFKVERAELQAYGRGELTEFTFKLDLHNTPFFKEVLEETRRVPYGQTATYGDIAMRVGRPNSARAIGRAMATNPIPIVLPCHRITGSNGSLTGYGGGLDMKTALLKMERVA